MSGRSVIFTPARGYPTPLGSLVGSGRARSCWCCRRSRIESRLISVSPLASACRLPKGRFGRIWIVTAAAFVVVFAVALPASSRERPHRTDTAPPPDLASGTASLPPPYAAASPPPRSLYDPGTARQPEEAVARVTVTPSEHTAPQPRSGGYPPRSELTRQSRGAGPPVMTPTGAAPLQISTLRKSLLPHSWRRRCLNNTAPDPCRTLPYTPPNRSRSACRDSRCKPQRVVPEQPCHTQDL